jgi:hypothetical protein
MRCSVRYLHLTPYQHLDHLMAFLCTCVVVYGIRVAALIALRRYEQSSGIAWVACTSVGWRLGVWMWALVRVAVLVTCAPACGRVRRWVVLVWVGVIVRWDTCRACRFHVHVSARIQFRVHARVFVSSSKARGTLFEGVVPVYPSPMVDVGPRGGGVARTAKLQ